ETADWRLGNALALDQTGNVHLGFFSPLLGLRHAVRSGSSWSTESVDPQPSAQVHQATFVVDGTGTPHFLYFSGASGASSNGIAHAMKIGSSWSVDETLDTVSIEEAGFVSCAADASGSVHVTYGTDQGQKYARWSNGSWVTQVIDPTPKAYYGSIAVVNGNPS